MIGRRDNVAGKGAGFCQDLARAIIIKLCGRGGNSNFKETGLTDNHDFLQETLSSAYSEDLCSMENHLAEAWS